MSSLINTSPGTRARPTLRSGGVALPVRGRIQAIERWLSPNIPERRRRRLPQTWDQKSHPWRYRAPLRTLPRPASVALLRRSENLPRSPRCQWHVSRPGFQSGHALVLMTQEFRGVSREDAEEVGNRLRASENPQAGLIAPSCPPTLRASLFNYQSRPPAEHSGSSNVWPLLDLVGVHRGA
jgi:hypothetical protein